MGETELQPLALAPPPFRSCGPSLYSFYPAPGTDPSECVRVACGTRTLDDAQEKLSMTEVENLMFTLPVSVALRRPRPLGDPAARLAEQGAAALPLGHQLVLERADRVERTLEA